MTNRQIKAAAAFDEAQQAAAEAAIDEALPGEPGSRNVQLAANLKEESKRIARFSDIPQFPTANYTTDVEWRSLDARIADPRDSTWEGCNLEPDFQRGHVWTDDQRSAFVEYGLMGGETSMAITLNHPNWMGSWKGPFELIDGLQRITAVRMFTRGEIKAFGLYIHEFEDKMLNMAQRFHLRILTLKSRKDVLRQYLLMNSGGVVHSRDEIERVKALLVREEMKTKA